MAEKANTTSLTSNSLFPGSDDLGPLSGPFALAPALVPSASTTISSSNDSITEEIILNKGMICSQLDCLCLCLSI